MKMDAGKGRQRSTRRRKPCVWMIKDVHAPMRAEWLPWHPYYDGPRHVW